LHDRRYLGSAPIRRRIYLRRDSIGLTSTGYPLWLQSIFLTAMKDGRLPGRHLGLADPAADDDSDPVRKFQIVPTAQGTPDVR
jgi:hypothetical protein